MKNTLFGIADVNQGMANFGGRPGMIPGIETYHLVESSDLRDAGWINLDGLKEIQIHHGATIERHLLRPYDVLVTARAGTVQVGMVPPGVSRTVASVTLLVVRPHDRDRGMGHYIWYFLRSAWGQAQLKRRVTISSTMTMLSASNLGEVELLIPSPQQLDRIATLVEASEAAYSWAVEAARLRRDAVGDSIIGALDPIFGPKS